MIQLFLLLNAPLHCKTKWKGNFSSRWHALGLCLLQVGRVAGSSRVHGARAGDLVMHTTNCSSANLTRVAPQPAAFASRTANCSLELTGLRTETCTCRRECANGRAQMSSSAKWISRMRVFLRPIGQIGGFV